MLLDRKGNTAPCAFFDGATGRWRLTRLGKRWFAQNELSESVLQLLSRLYTTKADGRVVEHEGWYPVANLDHALRRRIEASFAEALRLRPP